MWQKCKNIYHLFVSLSVNIYYKFPARKLVVIGVTGTSGKTTTAHMIYEILKKSGAKVSLLSTIQGVIGGKEIDTGFHVTTPDPHRLPAYIYQIVQSGDTHLVLEVSSHALDQYRAAFIPFRVGVLTTLSHEHLDYHKTMVRYAKAKFKLLLASQTAVVPAVGIDEEIQKKSRFERIKKKSVSFGISQGDETQQSWKLRLLLPGDYNLLNALAAATVGKILSIDKKIITSALEHFSAIPGRFEEIPTKKGFRIIIDFAHKPDALEEVLKTARKEISKKGRVIVLYGCASQRDILKRPIMGKISGELADISILTDEDPRFEDSMKIINEIAAGCIAAKAVEATKNQKSYQTNTNLFIKIPDRSQAITFCITKLARKGDILLFCGKGHEKSMNYQGNETPWNEHQIVRKSLELL